MSNHFDTSQFYAGLFTRDARRVLVAARDDKFTAHRLINDAADNAKRAVYFDRLAQGV